MLIFIYCLKLFCQRAGNLKDLRYHFNLFIMLIVLPGLIAHSNMEQISCLFERGDSNSSISLSS